MRRHRRETEDSSLELLLDTMCNTFGGVMFIAISIFIVASAMTSDIAEKNRTGSDVKNLQQEIITLRKLCAELEQDIILKSSQTVQKNLLADDTLHETAALQQMLQNTIRQIKIQEKLSAHISVLLKNLQKEQMQLAAKLQKSASEYEQLEKKLQQQQQKNRKLQKSLLNDITLNFQVMRPSTREPFFLIMRNNKVWLVGPWRDTGETDRIDDSVDKTSVQTEQGELVTCHIKPGCGINVLSNNDLSPEFQTLLARIPDDRIIDFNISPDCAATAHRMREIFKKQKIRHGCSLAPENNSPFKFYYKEKAEYEY